MLFKKGLEMKTLLVIILALALLIFGIFYFTGIGAHLKELMKNLMGIF